MNQKIMSITAEKSCGASETRLWNSSSSRFVMYHKSSIKLFSSLNVQQFKSSCCRCSKYDELQSHNFSKPIANIYNHSMDIYWHRTSIFFLNIHLNIMVTSYHNCFYYMAGVCSRYNARSDWLSAASRQGIILP